MNRRELLKTTVLTAAGALAAPLVNRGRFSLFADEGPTYSTRTVDLVLGTTVIDMLGLLTLDWQKLAGWQRHPESFSDLDYLLLRDSGVNVFHPAVDPQSDAPHEAAVRWMRRWNRLLAGRPDVFLRVESAAGFEVARQARKVGVVLGFQNADHFRTATDVARFHKLGQRVSQLTYDRSNRLGTGCREGRDRGLTAFGAEVVAAMNRAGMAVDVSHCSERTCLAAFAASRRPVLVTHSNCRALAPHPRCKSDRVLRAMAAQGGVLGITTLPAFVRPGGRATLEDVLDHFDHAARLVGVEHVGLGSDVDVDARDPHTRQVRPRYRLAGMRHARRTFDLAEGLLRRGYREEHLRLILGGNFARALGQIWEAPAPRAVTAA